MLGLVTILLQSDYNVIYKRNRRTISLNKIKNVVVTFAISFLQAHLAFLKKDFMIECNK